AYLHVRDGAGETVAHAETGVAGGGARMKGADGLTGGRAVLAFRILVLAVILQPASPTARLPAQQPVSPSARLSAQSYEQRLLAVPDTASVRQMSKDLSAVPHMAGTPAQAATRDYVLARLRSWGIDAWSKEYTVYLPQPDTVAAWVLTGSRVERLSLEEPGSGPQVPPFNGYTGDGNVTAEVVYVNYGLIEDYKTLDSLGVSVRGKIAIARYGRSFRGIKAREAQKRGAVGLIVYSDPQDDGFFRGDVYPKGPMRPAGGIQRGSMMNGNGDPTTPSWSSVQGARRVPEDSLDIPRMPIIPMSYGNARRLLEPLAGPSVPQSWQGGLPFRYHVGPGPVRARMHVKTERGDRAFHKIWNTVAMIRGERWPDEWVVVGGHRDSWGPGARDNVSGTVSVLETARAFAALAREGQRPARTLVFATWDAEEWGLIGSTEWVEELEDSLRTHAVAYINEDGTFSGPNFSGAGSPSLKPLFRAAARAVPDPVGPGSVYDVWLKGKNGDTTQLTFGNLGGGSDFAGFYHHLGIPAGGIGFDGPDGIYHSMYDSYDWMSRFGDPQYKAHRAGAQLIAVILSRLANSDLLPLDYAVFGTEMNGLVAQLDSGLVRKEWNATVSTQPLKDALDRFTAVARAFGDARDYALARAGAVDPDRAQQVNRALMQVERRLTRPEGLVSRPWFRSLQFAADVDNGYATMAFPTVNEAIRYADPATANREINDLVNRVDQARAALVEAAAALR
ncbi:MAG TPA: M20/M25/M40 family metallo-hydrolase, partial [Gemmatimonadales bacterium]|nr:M20/M25/M40 family metallo-hydrolase [Gemmatimonadales bacterium]